MGGGGGAVDGDGLWTTAPIELMVPSMYARGAVDAQPLERRIRWVGGVGDGGAGAPFHTATQPLLLRRTQIFWFVWENQNERERERARGARRAGHRPAPTTWV